MRLGSRAYTVLASLLVLAVSCSSRRVETVSAPPPDAEVATGLVVEQFLRAANANDLDTMARLFGTRDGPILRRDPRDQVERRMFALASLLRHQAYMIRRTEVVPGRREEATKLIVAMTVGDRTVDVPYTLVFSKDRVWLVEQIGIDVLTRR